MHLRNAFALAPTSFALLTLGVPARALAADSPKETCLSAADQGQSLRDDGKYALAHDQFLTCARDVCPKLVHDQCTEWLHQLDESMPTVVFAVKDDHGADVGVARIFVDGKPIASELDGKPVPLDPGAHDLRFERDSPSQSVVVHVVLRTGEKNREVVAEFPSVDATPPAPTPEPQSPEPTGPPVPEKSEEPSFWNGRSVTSLTLVVAGVASIGVGMFFGFQSQSEKSDAATLRNEVGPNSACRTPPLSTTCQQLSSKVDAQNSDALLSDVLYGAGGVLAVGALATWFLWPKPGQDARASTAWVAPILDSSRVGLRVGGAF